MTSDVPALPVGRRAAPLAPMATSTLKAIQAALKELEGDETLPRRVRAAQELASLLSSLPATLAPSVSRLVSNRASPSLLVALMDECGDRCVWRDTRAQASNAQRLLSFPSHPVPQVGWRAPVFTRWRIKRRA